MCQNFPPPLTKRKKNNTRKINPSTAFKCTSTFIYYHFKVIKTKRELDTHVKYVHSTVRQFECEQCQRRFKRKGDLVVHMQSHTATPGFFCEVMTISILKVLWKHKFYYMLLSLSLMLFQKCGKSFFKKRNLKSHLSTHDTSDNSKKHECVECGRR